MFDTPSEAIMRCAALLCMLPLAGCSSSATNPVIPAETIYLTETISFTLADALFWGAVIGATWYVVDPLAPNWDVRYTKVADNRYRLEMKKKNFTTGGDGEAIELARRQGEKFAELQGYQRYQIVAWTEGVQSDMPIAYRWARGTVELQGYVPPEPSTE
jgi:hypothetical protein